MESVGHVGYKHDLCVILLSSVNIIGFVKLEKFYKKKNLVWDACDWHHDSVDFPLLKQHILFEFSYIQKTTFTSFLLI